MKELMENQNSIIFIDELHTLVGAGSAEARSMPPTSSSPPFLAEKFSASAQLPPPNTASPSKKIARSSAASRP